MDSIELAEAILKDMKKYPSSLFEGYTETSANACVEQLCEAVIAMGKRLDLLNETCDHRAKSIIELIKQKTALLREFKSQEWLCDNGYCTPEWQEEKEERCRFCGTSRW